MHSWRKRSRKKSRILEAMPRLQRFGMSTGKPQLAAQGPEVAWRAPHARTWEMRCSEPWPPPARPPRWPRRTG
eukprot:10882053-Alexandrium_andersonii.AAC.1